MTRSTRFRYDSHKDDGQFVDLKYQDIADEKNRCATRKFEARFIQVARRVGAPIFDYRKEEETHGKAQRLPPR
jgi:hypothetical protein